MSELIKDIKALLFSWVSTSISNSSTDSQLASAKAINTALSTKADSNDIPSASSTTPSADTSNGSVGTGTTWARSNHTHPKSGLYAEASHTHTGSDITDLNITLDDEVTANGTNAVKGGGIKNYVDAAVNEAVTGGTVIIDDAVTENSTNPVKSSGIYSALSSKANNNDIPTKVSDLTNDSGFLTSHQTVDSSLNSSSINPVQNKVIYSALDGKADSNDVPTKVSDLTNDSGYLTSHQDISGKENTSNKVTSINSNSTDTQYPSAKLLYDELEEKANNNHTQTSSTITDQNTYSNIGNSNATQASINSGVNTQLGLKSNKTSVPDLSNITFVSKNSDSTGSIIIGYLGD